MTVQVRKLLTPQRESHSGNSSSTIRKREDVRGRVVGLFALLDDNVSGTESNELCWFNMGGPLEMVMVWGGKSCCAGNVGVSLSFVDGVELFIAEDGNDVCVVGMVVELGPYCAAMTADTGCC